MQKEEGLRDLSRQRDFFRVKTCEGKATIMMGLALENTEEKKESNLWRADWYQRGDRPSHVFGPPLQRPQWLMKNTTLPHCFSRLFLKMSPTVIMARKLSTTAPQICAQLIMTKSIMRWNKRERTGEESDSVSRSTTLVQSERFKQLQDWSSLNSIQRFMAPSWWALMTLALSSHELDLYISTIIGLTANNWVQRFVIALSIF